VFEVVSPGPLIGVLCGAAAACRGDDEKPVVHGLKTEIYAGRDFSRFVGERIDPNIESFWEHGAPHEDAPVDEQGRAQEMWQGARKKPGRIQGDRPGHPARGCNFYGGDYIRSSQRAHDLNRSF